MEGGKKEGEDLKQSYCRKGRFYNPHQLNLRRRLGHMILWGLGYYKDSLVLPAIPEGFSYPQFDTIVDSNQPKVTWVNHSTFLVQVDGIVFLTDPIWSKRASPFSYLGPKRLHPVPLTLEQLPAINYVLISHDHYDHLDRATVRYLVKHHPQIVWCVPLRLKKWLRKQGAMQVVELDWWQSYQEPKTQVQFHSVPAQHYSGRTPLHYNKSLWCGWIVRTLCRNGLTKVFYFSGDTGYNEIDFKRIGKQFGGVDLSLIPIGVYRPRRFMRSVHAGPREAVWIHQEVQSKLSIGMHWGTFKLSSEPRNQPPYDLYCAMIEHALPIETFRALQPGETINW